MTKLTIQRVALAISMAMLGCNAATAPLETATEGTTPVSHSDDAAPAPETEEKAAEKLTLTDAEWREKLSPEEYHVLRNKGTERPFTNEYDHHFEPGHYECRGCGAVLFESDTKFNSGCGWPAFYAAKAGDRVDLHEDLTHGMVRTEVTCARCGGHLGHIFDDAPQTPTGQRYCINSVAIKFVPASGGE